MPEDVAVDLVADEPGERVDVFVTRMLEVPRGAVQAALRSGAVFVGGACVKPSHKLDLGDAVRGRIALATAADPAGEEIPLQVAYEDERCLVVDKPAGLVTHPAGGHETGTLVNALLGSGVPLAQKEPARPGIVHRLDKDTSGLLLVAKDDAALDFLQGALQRRAVARHYFALVRGTVDEDRGAVDAPLGRHPRDRRKIAVIAEGRTAVTHYEVLGRAEGVTLLDVRLETGRTHQIRVHLSHLGHPVLGDGLYNGKNERSAALGLTRPFLHAYRLVFPHPDGGQRSVSSPLPDDLVEALGRAALPVPQE